MRINAALFVFSATVVSAFAQGATDALPSTGQPKNQVVATIPVGMTPAGVVVNPISQLIYVANAYSNSVSVIEAATNTVVVVIPVGSFPFEIAITPDGKTVYVENDGGNQTTFSVIYTPTNTVFKTIGVPGVGGIQLAMSPDGAKLYLAIQFPPGVEGVAVIDTSTIEFSGTIKINDGPGWGGVLPIGVIFNSSGRFAYALSSAVQKIHPATRFFVSKINTATEKQIKATGPLNLNPGRFGINNNPWMSIYGQNLYIDDGTHDIAVFETKTDAVVKRIPISPNYTGSQGSVQSNTITPEGQVGSSAVTPDGKYLYVTYMPDKVVAIDTATYQKVGSPIQVGQGPALGIAIAPDGLRAYVTNSGDGTVSVIDISPQ